MKSRQLKKQCAIINCANPNCKFPHPEPALGTRNESDLKPKKKYHGATPHLNGRFDGFLTLPCVVDTSTPIDKQNPNYGVKEHIEPSRDLLFKCKRCHSDFLLTIGEQIWFNEKGFTFPKTCKPCRIARQQDPNIEIAVRNARVRVTR